MLIKNWMSKDVITVDADQSMQDAIFLLQEHKINILPVMKKGNLIGIITDRDLKKASPSDATTLDIHELLYLVSKIKVKNIMTRKPYTVYPNDTVEEAAAILLEKKISGLPVVDETNRLVGIITRSDLFRVIVSFAGLGKKGIEIAIRFKDLLGPIRDVGELIHEYGGRTAAILSSEADAPSGFINVYFRVYDIDREKLPLLIKLIEEKGTMLYMVDHRKGERVIYNDSK